MSDPVLLMLFDFIETMRERGRASLSDFSIIPCAPPTPSEVIILLGSDTEGASEIYPHSVQGSGLAIVGPVCPWQETSTTCRHHAEDK